MNGAAAYGPDSIAEITYLQTSEVARRCGVSASTVLMWERLGLIPAVRTARGIRLFHQADVERFAEQRAAKQRAGVA